MTTATKPSSPDLIAKLQGVTTPDQVGPATASFGVEDWARLEDEYLDIIALNLFDGDALASLGVDMDDDPVAVFCRLVLDARAVRLGTRAHDPFTAVAHCTRCCGWRTIAGTRRTSWTGLVRVRGKCTTCGKRQNSIVAWAVAS